MNVQALRLILQSAEEQHVDFLRLVFQTAAISAEYIKDEGAFCPVCERFRGIRQRAKVTGGCKELGVRYCLCERCGVTFKAIEKIYPSCKTQETVAEKPKKRQSKYRKR